MHVHVGALQAVVFLAYLLIIGFLLRTAAAVWKDRPIGKALAFIY